MHSVRSELYMLAAGLFNVPRSERDRAMHGLALDLLESEIVDLPWRASLRALARELGEEREVQSTTAEYLRLFVLPLPRGTASPFATDWLRDSGVSLWGLEDLMASQGLGMSDENELTPDHIAAELELMSHLVDGGSRDTQRHFMREHLACWVPQLAQAIRKANPLPRFAVAADFIESLIAWDLAQLEAGWRPFATEHEHQGRVYTC